MTVNPLPTRPDRHRGRDGIGVATPDRSGDDLCARCRTVMARIVRGRRKGSVGRVVLWYRDGERRRCHGDLIGATRLGRSSILAVGGASA